MCKCTKSIHRLYNKMTMEVILSTAFGRAVDVQGGKGGKLYEAALTVFRALFTPGENEGPNIIGILQFAMCKLCTGIFVRLNLCIIIFIIIR